MPKKSIPIKLKRRVYEKDYGQVYSAPCLICGTGIVYSNMDETDGGHIWAENLGGPVCDWNIISQCKSCNQANRKNLWDLMPRKYPAVPIPEKVQHAQKIYEAYKRGEIHVDDKGNITKYKTTRDESLFRPLTELKWYLNYDLPPHPLPINEFRFLYAERWCPLSHLFSTKLQEVLIMDEYGNQKWFSLATYDGWARFEKCFNLSRLPAVEIHTFIRQISNDEEILSLIKK